MLSLREALLIVCSGSSFVSPVSKKLLVAKGYKEEEY